MRTGWCIISFIGRNGLPWNVHKVCRRERWKKRMQEKVNGDAATCDNRKRSRSTCYSSTWHSSGSSRREVGICLVSLLLFSLDRDYYYLYWSWCLKALNLGSLYVKSTEFGLTILRPVNHNNFIDIFFDFYEFSVVNILSIMSSGSWCRLEEDDLGFCSV